LELVDYNALTITELTSRIFYLCYQLLKMEEKGEITYGSIAAFGLFYHATRVATMMRQFAVTQGMREEEVELYYKTGLLHDLGKMGDARIISLWTSPKKLTEPELKEVRLGHVARSNIENGIKKMGINPYSVDRVIFLSARYHHVRLKQGPDSYPREYPSDLPEIVFILGIIDALEAILSTLRPYKQQTRRNYINKEVKPISWASATRLMFNDVKQGKFDEELFWKVIETLTEDQLLNVVFLPNLLGNNI